MDSPKKNRKTKTESSKRRNNRLSDYSSGSGSGEGKNIPKKVPSSFTEGITSSTSESSSYKKGSYNTASFADGASSVYSEQLESKSGRRVENQPSSLQEATSSVYTDASYRSDDGRKNLKGGTSAVYPVNMPGASFPATESYNSNSDSLGSDQSRESSFRGRQRRPDNIRLMPFKVKDVMEMIKDNPAYKDKSPVMIKVKENDIDQILEGQGVIRGKAEPLDQYLRPRNSPDSLQKSLREESFRMPTGADIGRPKTSQETKQRHEKPLDELPFSGADRTQKIFAMPDIQAYPVVHSVPRRGRNRSRPAGFEPPRRRVLSKSRSRRRRSRPVRRHSRDRRVVRRQTPRRRYISPCTAYPMCDDQCPITRPYRGPRITGYGPRRVMSNTSNYERRVPRRVVSNYAPYYDRPQRVVSNYNTPYYASAQRVGSYNTPMTSDNSGLYYADSKTEHGRFKHRGNCCCNLCSNKLQFVQPGLCSKKKTVWTNEYAVIPKPQVHLIDPCEELDPAIYPRADNPCIRDGQGNPLTDCIGRPLRSPVGKKFLNFTANGSVMETSLRGNFYTGQPPLCVKCPMPSGTCGPDATHNWWMNCGYPIMSDMNPFYKRVLAAEMGPC
ncbi:uncharacterized protein LOC128986104 [Macrosteles quadrilineatus]|uniref:uncharacterized protein LOC128986104 n=1 Tax=Macrosteles quadrilineatus TaxID=74068 RepID=UPI0023E0CC48|nr:uncharacterized protein LOC128986104 [Macrosteles quadrilineatus]